MIDNWIPKMRKPAIALAAAVALAVIASVDTTFAQVSFHRDLVLGDISITTARPNTGAALTGDQVLMVPTTTPPLAPGLIDLGSVPAVSAHQMSLVALASEQVSWPRPLRVPSRLPRI